MPAISRWMIRLALTYFMVGIVLGALMLIHKAYPLHPSLWLLLPIHIECTLFGWIIQLTLGTAYWMLPRFLEGPQRGSKLLAATMVGSLNLGILLVVLEPLLEGGFPLRLSGRLLELLAVVLFVALHWNRIVTYRNR